MALVVTNFRNTRESARQLRVEPNGAIVATNVQNALEALATTPQVTTPTPITAAQSPYNVLIGDFVLYVDTSGGPVTINLQATANRFNRELVIKDVTGNAAANNISVVGSGTEKIDTLSPYPINADFGGLHVKPTATGYTVVP